MPDSDTLSLPYLCIRAWRLGCENSRDGNRSSWMMTQGKVTYMALSCQLGAQKARLRAIREGCLEKGALSQL